MLTRVKLTRVNLTLECHDDVITSALGVMATGRRGVGAGESRLKDWFQRLHHCRSTSAGLLPALLGFWFFSAASTDYTDIRNFREIPMKTRGNFTHSGSGGHLVNSFDVFIIRITIIHDTYDISWDISSRIFTEISQKTHGNFLPPPACK